jgi:hypothetical protein
MTTELLLNGLDGSNLLGFLAAIGTLQTLADAWPEHEVRLGWCVAGGWRPYLRATIGLTDDDVVVALSRALTHSDASDPFEIAKDLNLSPETFRAWATHAASTSTPTGRRLCDFVVAFGCEAILDRNKGKARDALGPE